MIVLVTGSTGFIGSHLCRALVALGHHVRAFHRLDSPQDLLAGMPVEHAVGDVTQPVTLKQALQGVEVVFHTAAKVGSRRPGRMYDVTVSGTRYVLAAALHAGVRRLVHTSSVASMGVPTRVDACLLLDEHHAWNCRPEQWRYGYAKHLAEREVLAAVARGLDAVIVNPAVVVGAGDLHRIAGNVLLQAARGRLPAVPSGGLNAVHIEDVVAGHLAALGRGRIGERYILGGENLKHAEFLSMAAEYGGHKAPRFLLPDGILRAAAGPFQLIRRFLPLPINVESLRRAGYYFYYDSLKARVELGVREPRPIRQAITEALDWYRERGEL